MRKSRICFLASTPAPRSSRPPSLTALGVNYRSCAAQRPTLQAAPPSWSETSMDGNLGDGDR